MDTIQPLQAILPDRPLLGVWVLVTCLAGGAATQNLAVVPHTIDRVDYRFDPGQRLPAVELGQAARPAALVAPPAFRQFRRADQVTASAGDAELASSLPETVRAVLDAASAQPLDSQFAPSAALAPAPAQALSAAPLSDPVRVAQSATEPAPALAATRSPAAFDAAFAGLGTPVVEAGLSEAAAPIEAAAPALANPPELRGFDLARVVPSGLRKPVRLAAPRAAPQPAVAGAKPALAGKRDRLLDATVYHATTIMIGGQSAGQIDVRIGADMKPSIKVGDLLGMVSAQMDPELSAHLAAASGAADYVSFAMLRDAGFKVSYNAGADSVSIGVAD